MKFVTKSTKLLHIDDKVGSKVGKDADVVLWYQSSVNLCSQKKRLSKVQYIYDAKKES
jgi:imidazolonepropionase-like amidohydrolase